MCEGSEAREALGVRRRFLRHGEAHSRRLAEPRPPVTLVRRLQAPVCLLRLEGAGMRSAHRTGAIPRGAPTLFRAMISLTDGPSSDSDSEPEGPTATVTPGPDHQ